MSIFKNKQFLLARYTGIKTVTLATYKRTRPELKVLLDKGWMIKCSNPEIKVKQLSFKELQDILSLEDRTIKKWLKEKPNAIELISIAARSKDDIVQK